MSRYIEIAEDNETFEHRYVDPATKVQTATVFTLRVMPPDVRARIEATRTDHQWVRGQRVPELKTELYIADCLDYVIVSWDGVRRQGEELSCTRENKRRLPEAVKTEIMRICVSRDLTGTVLAPVEGDGDVDADKDAVPGDPTHRSAAGSTSSSAATASAPRPAAD